MQKKTALFTVLLMSFLAAEPRIGGMVRNYTALNLYDNYNYSMLQNTLRLTFELRGAKGALNADVYVYQYGRDFTPELNLQQLYIDLYLNRIDFRLGRQQIIWGKADGVFITDVVSPKDLREFLLPDFNEIRQGTDALATSFYMGNHTFSLVLSPVFRPTTQPEDGSIWKPDIQFPVSVVRIDTSHLVVPLTLANSEAFFRWSAMLSAIDFELVGSWMWDDDPALHLKKYGHRAAEGFQLDSITVTPEHHRIVMGGGAVSATIKGLVLKGEAAWYQNKKLRTSDPAINDGITESDYVHYMIGGSYTLAGVDLHLQFIQKILLDYNKSMLEDEFQNMMTILIHKSFLRETLHMDLFSYVGLDEGDALVRPTVGYDISDGLKVIAGVNLFLGNSGYFGRFDKNDMVYSKLSFSF